MGLALLTSCAFAQEVENPYVPKDPRTEPFLSVEFSPVLDTPVPLDLEFLGDDGVQSTLRDRLIEGKPTILAIVYYRCPTMCNQILNGLVQTLKEIDYKPGEDFNLLAVSFDPEETHVTAAAKKLNYMTEYGDTDGEGWEFMVGKEPEIRQLTDAVGFGYKYDAMDDQYAHGSGLLILTADGRISRFLPGMMYPLIDTRLALVEAGEGKVGTLSDKLALLCYSYDPLTGKYGLLINRIIMVACLLTVAAVAWMILSLIRMEKKRNETTDS
ncbi:SCO family protein [Kiritimatiellaeota bacterium B1221]|nr:SCO family protein [Kiritimatiellaeota bacterium B1221]